MKLREQHRVICDCQRHAIRERKLWRRAFRVARNAKSGALALLVGVPLAFGVNEIPMEAMSTTLQTLTVRSTTVEQYGGRTFRIFTTDKIRAEFLDPAPRRELTLDVAKEQFFKTQVPYGEIILREARRNRLSPELVAAVVQAESDFRPCLVSQKDAGGLMQIVPSTARDLGIHNVFDPEQNIAAGTRYLRYLFNRFGDQRIVLAAYNAGEGNIERFRGIPPFAETRDYLQRVDAHVRWYRQRINTAYLTTSRIRTTYAQ
jgi:soluble lytic murein transglycosylase-like protein